MTVEAFFNIAMFFPTFPIASIKKQQLLVKKNNAHRLKNRLWGSAICLRVLTKQAIPFLVGRMHTQTPVCYYVCNSLDDVGRTEVGTGKEKVSQEQEPMS